MLGLCRVLEAAKSLFPWLALKRASARSLEEGNGLAHAGEEKASDQSPRPPVHVHRLCALGGDFLMLLVWTQSGLQVKTDEPADSWSR